MKEYIDREAVMQAFADYVWNSNHSDLVPAPQWNHAVEIMRDFPAADVVEARHGRWIEDACGAIWCSNCSHAEESCEQKMYRYRYCPNCGAKMDGGADDAAD